MAPLVTETAPAPAASTLTSMPLLFILSVALVPMVTPLLTSTVVVASPPLLWRTMMPVLRYQRLACGLLACTMLTEVPVPPTVRAMLRAVLAWVAVPTTMPISQPPFGAAVMVVVVAVPGTVSVTAFA